MKKKVIRKELEMDKKANGLTRRKWKRKWMEIVMVGERSWVESKLNRLFWQEYFYFRQEDRATTLNVITSGSCVKHKQEMMFFVTKISRLLIKTSVYSTCTANWLKKNCDSWKFGKVMCIIMYPISFHLSSLDMLQSLKYCCWFQMTNFNKSC